MKKLFKISAGFVVLGIITAVYIWFFVFNKPHRNYETADADFTMSAEACFYQYSDGSDQSKLFLDKVLQLEGIPASVESTDSTVIVVFAFESGMFGDEGIRCTMLPNYHKQTQNMDLSEKVSIKGYCAGYNGTDVILEHCSLITQ